MQKHSNSQLPISPPKCSATVNAVVRSLHTTVSPLSLSPKPPPTFPPPSRILNQNSLTSQKLLKTQRNIPIAILIIFLKHIRHPLQNNTALHKQIETHLPLPALVIRRIHQFDKGGGKPIAECDERVGVFEEGDAAAAVFVEAVEEGAPGGEEGP